MKQSLRDLDFRWTRFPYGSFAKNVYLVRGGYRIATIKPKDDDPNLWQGSFRSFKVDVVEDSLVRAIDRMESILEEKNLLEKQDMT